MQGSRGGEARCRRLPAAVLPRETGISSVIVMPTSRRFQHPDGRAWSIAVEGVAYTVELIGPDEAPLSQSRRLRDAAEVARAAEQLVAKQLAEGFVELTPST